MPVSEAAGLAREKQKGLEPDAESSFRCWSTAKWNELETKAQNRRAVPIDRSHTDHNLPRRLASALAADDDDLSQYEHTPDSRPATGVSPLASAMQWGSTPQRASLGSNHWDPSQTLRMTFSALAFLSPFLSAISLTHILCSCRLRLRIFDLNVELGSD